MGRKSQTQSGLKTLDKKEIRISESLLTFASGFEIAQSLRKMSNFIRSYVQVSGTSQFPFAIPSVPVLNGVVLDPQAEFPDGMGIWEGDSGNTHILLGARQQVATNHVWDVETGIPIPESFSDFGSDHVGPWSFAFAPNVSVPTTFVTAKGISSKKKIQETTPGSGILLANEYSPTFNPDSQAGFEARPSIFYYHLNRLWMLYQSVIERRSLIFFTDASDPETIRGFNFLDLPDLGTAIFRASASDLDIGAQAHLLFAGEESIWILDGDPTLGNASFRLLKRGFGIKTSRHVAETSEGACFLATDNLIYLVPRGALEPIPISYQVKNNFSHEDTSLFLAWRFPYLFVFTTGSKIWMCDLTNPQNPYWSGPHLQKTPLIMKCFGGDHPFQPTKIFVACEADGDVKIASVRDNVIGNSDQVLESGYFSAPDAGVRFRRTFLTFQQAAIIQHFRLSVFDSLGRTEVHDFTVPAVPIPVGEMHETVMIPELTALGGEYFFLHLESRLDLDVIPRLQNLRSWIVEYRIDPRKT